MKARRAVGDDSQRQAVIKTVHGHGYRFIAPLTGAVQTAAG
jgi:DNA-binding winged helix-turn-helix (wHTH) protein